MSRTESQNRQIERDLKKGKKITPLQALKDYGCLRLSGRIFELRERGLNIIAKMVYEHPYKYAEYRLKK